MAKMKEEPLFENKFEQIKRQFGLTDKRYCLNCNDTLTGKQRKFCSTKCNMAYYYDQITYSRAHRKTQERSCVLCNVKYMPKTRNQKYCGICKPKYESRVTSEKILKENRTKFYSEGDIFILDMDTWEWRLMTESERMKIKDDIN